MPAADADLENDPKLPFPPYTRSHILHCSCHFWHPRYRSLTPKTRLITLSPSFVSYLHADGIQLPPETEADDDDADEFETDLSTLPSRNSRPADDSSDSDEDNAEGELEEAGSDPSSKWPEIHSAIRSTIAELGGKVVPKLNWSAPKDATWINPTNSMECRTPNDVYLLLKSSDFVTHDLQHAFDGCEFDDEEDFASESNDNEAQASNLDASQQTDVPTQPSTVPEGIPYTIALRKSFALNPSVEFRCFVRQRRLLAISQRSVNYFDFLFPLAPRLRSLMSEFFERHLQRTFPDENFVFDAYVPDPYTRVWLIDFNPWAPRTDPLLFSWLEILTMDGPAVPPGRRGADATGESDPRDEDEDEEADEEIFQPELRLIKRDDPEAYSFNTPQYSAHKLPKDVVQASQSGEGPLREFAEQWKEVLNRGAQQQQGQ